MLGFFFLGLTEIVIVHDTGKDTLANRINVILCFLGLNVKRNLECILDAASLSEEQVQVGHLGVEVLDGVLLALDSHWDLVEETLHQTTDDHTVVLRHLAV